MKATVGRVLLLLALATSSLFVAAPAASAQGQLEVTLVENPFLCDTILRPLGTVSGLIPGEPLEISWKDGVSTNNADASGRYEMKWSCGVPETVTLTVRGLSSGATTSFVVTEKAAPPPPDAPIGAAFDAKSAMTAGQMAIWKDFSPFDTVGVYIDVNSSWDNRADKIQSNLNASWVSQVFADGWKLIPIYVGFQAPDACATARYEGLSADRGTARNQGLASAADAVRSVSELGIGPGNPIYYDMEAYRPGCAEAVLAFLDAWTEGLHSAGYLSGVYGSRSSTMWDLSRTLGRAGFDAPDAVWVSTGNGRATASGLDVPTDGQWANARMHQYRLNITRTYGGVTRQIDENIVNAPLATSGTGTGVVPTSPSTPAGTDSDGDGIAEPSPDNCDSVANPDQADLDNDGDGDVCDRDIDGDGVDNVMDFAPRDPDVSAVPTPTAVATAEPTVQPTVEPTAEPTVAPAPEIVDSDGDGVAEPSPDNCDSVANADQAALDNDGDGDVCDSDIDGDGVANEADQEPRDPFIGAAPAPTVEPTTAEPAVSDDVDPATATTPVPSVTPVPQVAVLPTPAPTATVAPLPTAIPDPTAQPIAAPALPPAGSLELEPEMVTITVEDDTPLLPYLIATLSVFSVFCLGMGVRSFRHNRSPVI